MSNPIPPGLHSRELYTMLMDTNARVNALSYGFREFPSEHVPDGTYFHINTTAEDVHQGLYQRQEGVWVFVSDAPF